MRSFVRVLLPIAVLAVASAIAFVTVANRETPDRRPPRVAVTEVEVQRAAPREYTVNVSTRGTVRPRTESTLIPEVAGRVVALADNMRAGEFFESGDVLFEIDPRDYSAEMTIARSELAQARTILAEEEARAAQARRDWQRLGEGGEPDDLVLRKPQLAGARAAVASAEARLAKARFDLERTKLVAPYAGRVLEQNVDVGQYVSPGTVMARVYAVDYVEVRLPLTDRQLEFVEVPEIYRGDSPGARGDGPRVTLSARIGSREHTWQGRVVRAEGSIDTQSRQLFVVAQVDDPYGKGPTGRPPLKIGQFVEAEIEGNTLTDVIVIPRGALRAGGEVMVVDARSRLESRRVEVVWSDGENAVIGGGLAAGDRVVLTPLGAGMTGVEVVAREVGEPDGGGAPASERATPARTGETAS